MAIASHQAGGFRWRWLIPVLLAVAAFHFSPFAGPLDRAWFDFASRHPLRAPPAPPPSALVLVDDLTLARLSASHGQRWPFDRAMFAALLVGLDRAGAERVLVDFTFFEESQAAEQDLLLGAVAAAIPSVVLARTEARLPVVWPEEFRKTHPEFFSRPRMGRVELQPDEDSVSRRALTHSLAAAALPPGNENKSGLVRWYGGLDQLKAQGVPVLSAGPYIAEGLPILDRISREVPDFSPQALARALAKEPSIDLKANAVRGRTVFVGANAAGTFDLKPLPVGRLEPGVLLHWTAWANLSTNGFISTVPASVTLLLSSLVVGALAIVARRKPGLTTAGLVATGLAILVLPCAYGAFALGWSLPPATLIAAALIMLGCVAVENFWLERLRKQEIQAMFGAYVDPVVVANLVRNPEALRLGGERRQASVFFSDLVGFTDFSEKLSPEDLLALVNAYLEETSECLIDYGAYIDKYIGDAVMAVFGAPQPLKDHALAACEGALATLKLVEGINTRFGGAAGATLRVRIGINSGEMIMGNLGSTRKKNYTVLGDAVNLASRLEGANKEFGTSIMLGDSTARLVGDRMATRPLTRLRVKGKLQAIEVHELIGRPAELSETQRQFLSAYRDGYARYAARDFAAASEAFTRALAAQPHDQVTEAHLKRATDYAQHPPPADWEPILKLDTK
jgi:adenylate cyclase